ncbi:glycosyl transferase family 90 [Stella humosa]|uniref:Glycosyl transferase family 90 n=1 Tax=Stella humosa TaxID=94 RepID=A0A3N1KZU9_9PROT|nr:glycosyl transferase family 90 [Stella humosa]ROP83726.1 glycosyl transferase family 90 [Stella humosa]
MRLGGALRSAGRLEEARAVFARALALAPANMSVRIAAADVTAGLAWRDRDWPLLERTWNPILEQSGNLPMTAGAVPGLPSGLIRVAVSPARIEYGFGDPPADWVAARLDVLAARMLRYAMFWRTVLLGLRRRFTVLFDPSDGDGDLPALPRVAFSGRGDDTYLIPDFNYVTSVGYDRLLQTIVPVRWAERRAGMLWRGAPTGSVPPGGGWADLPRVRLCRMADPPGQPGGLDAGFHKLVATARFGPGARDAMAPLLRPPVPAEEQGHWRHLVDIDGYTNAWSGLFQRLAAGSAVLKVQSADGWRQWYYDRLRPWVNMVPVASDLSDLRDKADWLDRHPADALAIGQAGAALARSLDWVAVMGEATAAVDAADRALRKAAG